MAQPNEIVLANSGEEALTLCADLKSGQFEIPVIISDQYMQGIEGDKLLIQLHALYPDSLKIMLTGRADADSVGNVVNAAALYRYIRKPWDETDLILTITEALRCFHQKQQLSEQNVLLKTVNAKLENSLLLLLATLSATADGILALDDQGKVISFNHKFSQVWDISHDLMSPQSSWQRDEGILKFLMEQRLSPSDAIDFQQMIQARESQKHGQFTLPDNTIIEYCLQPQRLQGNLVGQIWSFRDVTQEQNQAALIKHQAFHDALTNLPNRILFYQKLEETLAQAEMTSGIFAIMFVDLDHFKEINDTFGHFAGDRLLEDLVQRLLPCIRAIDVLARWGGDEFVLLLPNLSGIQNTKLIASRLLQS